jgi:bifunctional UDP-N-acetylglucosamine pyrophosphorylase / glucosamine-1-phosphate N-acetyltransferase
MQKIPSKDNKDADESHLNFTAILLAGGQGKRMMSPLPKVLHPVAGIPMIQYLINALRTCQFKEIRAVVGSGEQLVRPILENQGIVCCKQQQQLGTADAVKAVGVDSIEGSVLIANGDHPLLRAEHIASFVLEFEESKADIAVVTAELKNPGNFGRVVRHYENIKAIVEAKDASKETLKIREINTGIYLVKASILNEYLPQITNANAQKEFYLTDIISLCVEARKKVIAISGPKEAAFGVNNQKELSRATQLVMREKINKLLDNGVLVIDPRSTYVEPTVAVGPGSVLYPGAYLRGTTKIGAFCVIEPNCFIVDSVVQDSVQIRAGSYLEKVSIASRATVGPYARLRPGTEIGEEAHIGNFVELKKTKFGARAKAGHLSYLGDAEIGEDTNIGCGTITCNYAADKKKYRTKIGKNVFVGSDTQFVAPIEVGDDAVIGSGSTITKNVPSQALAVARGKQFVKENYVKKQGS